MQAAIRGVRIQDQLHVRPGKIGVQQFALALPPRRICSNTARDLERSVFQLQPFFGLDSRRACDARSAWLASLSADSWLDGGSGHRPGRRDRPPVFPEGGGRGGRRFQAASVRGRVFPVIRSMSSTRLGFLAMARIASATSSPRCLIRPMAKRLNSVVFAGPWPVRIRLRSSSKLQSRTW